METNQISFAVLYIWLLFSLNFSSAQNLITKDSFCISDPMELEQRESLLKKWDWYSSFILKNGKIINLKQISGEIRFRFLEEQIQQNSAVENICYIKTGKNNKLYHWQMESDSIFYCQNKYESQRFKVIFHEWKQLYLFQQTDKGPVLWILEGRKRKKEKSTIPQFKS